MHSRYLYCTLRIIHSFILSFFLSFFHSLIRFNRFSRPPSLAPHTSPRLVWSRVASPCRGLARETATIATIAILGILVDTVRGPVRGPVRQNVITGIVRVHLDTENEETLAMTPTQAMRWNETTTARRALLASPAPSSCVTRVIDATPSPIEASNTNAFVLP